MKVPATGRGAGQPLRLTVLLDTSGSMEREDRAAAMRRAMEVLVSLLGPNDRVTLVGFARQPRLLAEDVHGDQANALLALIAHIPAEGGTNFEEALKLGGELARRHFEPQAQNRIVLLTDGAANLGNADPAQLALAVETLRQQGLAFDACGVGTDGLDDAMLEALTRKGAGRYSVLDTSESADAGFARQLAGAFRPAAENVKVQVRFNPARVGNYRLNRFRAPPLAHRGFSQRQGRGSRAGRRGSRGGRVPGRSAAAGRRRAGRRLCALSRHGDGRHDRAIVDDAVRSAGEGLRPGDADDAACRDRRVAGGKAPRGRRCRTNQAERARSGDQLTTPKGVRGEFLREGPGDTLSGRRRWGR